MRIDIQQLEFIDPKLREIILDLENEFNPDCFTVTSMYRIDDTGVHGTLPLRGIDIRCHIDVMGTFLENYINNKWIYDFERPDKKCAIYHDVGNGKHLHIQSHPNTVKEG